MLDQSFLVSHLGTQHIEVIIALKFLFVKCHLILTLWLLFSRYVITMRNRIVGTDKRTLLICNREILDTVLKPSVGLLFPNFQDFLPHSPKKGGKSKKPKCLLHTQGIPHRVIQNKCHYTHSYSITLHCFRFSCLHYLSHFRHTSYFFIAATFLAAAAISLSVALIEPALLFSALIAFFFFDSSDFTVASASLIFWALTAAASLVA